MQPIAIQCKDNIPQIQADLLRGEIQNPPTTVGGYLTAAYNEFRHAVPSFISVYRRFGGASPGGASAAIAFHGIAPFRAQDVTTNI